jgi:hypothetical protein
MQCPYLDFGLGETELSYSNLVSIRICRRQNENALTIENEADPASPQMGYCNWAILSYFGEYYIKFALNVLI